MERKIQLLPKIPSGIEGLDKILNGGLPNHCLYLVKGESGTGKTTLGMQFLIEGAKAGEDVLYLTLSENRDDIQAVANSHGWDLHSVHIHELTAVQPESGFHDEQTIFPTSQIELREVTDEIMEVIQRIRPTRIVFDSLHEIRLLADSPLRYRRYILGIRQVLIECQATVIFLDRELDTGSGTTLHSLVHGVFTLELMPLDYGEVRRRLRVAKMRGMPFHEGYHDFRIESGGLVVYPRLQFKESAPLISPEVIQSGVESLDILVGGGLEVGTACLIIGQTGTGKTTTALLFAFAAAKIGKVVSLFLFEERLATLLQRAINIGLDIRPSIQSGQIRIHQINAGEISPGEFARRVCDDVEQHHAEVILIDSLNGYLNSMPQERLLLIQMHELLTYLAGKQVLSFLTLTQHGMLDPEPRSTVDMSYLADTVLLIRHFEAVGEIRQAISVLKKRFSVHERSIRELRIGSNGVRVGEPLVAFQGVLTGHPVYTGSSQALIDAPGKEGSSDGD